MGLGGQVLSDSAAEDDHICLTCFAGMRKQVLLTKNTDNKGNVTVDKKQVLTPIYTCAVCLKRANQCSANGSQAKAFGPRDINNFRKLVVPQKQDQAEMASIPKALLVICDDWCRAMWAIYPKCDRDNMRSMCECALDWIQELSDVRDFERHGDIHIQNWVLNLTREREHGEQDLDDLQVFTPPPDTPSRTIYELTEVPENVASLSTPMVAAEDNLVDGRGRVTVEEIRAQHPFFRCLR